MAISSSLRCCLRYAMKTWCSRQKALGVGRHCTIGQDPPSVCVRCQDRCTLCAEWQWSCMAYLARAMEQHPADSYTCGYRKGEKDQYVCAKEDNSTATLWLVRGIDTRAKGSSLTVYKIKIGFIKYFGCKILQSATKKKWRRLCSDYHEEKASIVTDYSFDFDYIALHVKSFH